MARASEHDPAHVIEEFETLAERGARWVRDHLALAIAVLAIVLIGAAALGAYASRATHRAEAASDALDLVSSEYMQAMGASPDDLSVPELANPAAAAEIRSQFAERFAEVAEEHAGTAPAAFARLEQGNLAQAAGDFEGAIAIWRQAIEEHARRPSLRALLEQRIARAYEGEQRWAEAAAAYEAAAAVSDYRLRDIALAEAARCLQQAGETERARDLAMRVPLESPSLMLPEHLRSMVAELRQLPAPPAR
ncbi:MAG TPA: tetratricopeptide repeat protein [Myxococcota bacterium]|nr:tetratricopeptide repeat protein [Myxococcota bacterium]